MAHLVLTNAFLQSAKAAAMCMPPFACANGLVCCDVLGTTKSVQIFQFQSMLVLSTEIGIVLTVCDFSTFTLCAEFIIFLLASLTRMCYGDWNMYFFLHSFSECTT